MAELDKLDMLYKTVAYCEKLELDLPSGTLEQINDMEEQLIKDEVLPLIHNNIEPTLRRVKRPLVLVVEYDPAGMLKVNLSRKVKIAAQISDAKEISPDPKVEHRTLQPQKKKDIINKPTRLRVTMPGGRVIEANEAQETLRQFVLAVGVDKVRAMGKIANKMPLVSNTIDEKYRSSQKPLGNGWYLMTGTSTKTKKEQIEEIALRLGIKVDVKIVPK